MVHWSNMSCRNTNDQPITDSARMQPSAPGILSVNKSTLTQPQGHRTALGSPCLPHLRCLGVPLLGPQISAAYRRWSLVSNICMVSLLRQVLASQVRDSAGWLDTNSAIRFHHFLLMSNSFKKKLSWTHLLNHLC